MDRGALSSLKPHCQRVHELVLSILVYSCRLETVKEGGHFAERHTCALCYAVYGVLGDIAAYSQCTLDELGESAEKRSAAKSKARIDAVIKAGVKKPAKKAKAEKKAD